MKFILKLLLAPLVLVLWIVEWALTLALKASAVVCVIASALFLLSGFFYFVDGNVQNGCICLGIAFLLSPYGLHYLAVKLTARFSPGAGRTSPLSGKNIRSAGSAPR